MIHLFQSIINYFILFQFILYMTLFIMDNHPKMILMFYFNNNFILNFFQNPTLPFQVNSTQQDWFIFNITFIILQTLLIIIIFLIFLLTNFIFIIFIIFIITIKKVFHLFIILLIFIFIFIIIIFINLTIIKVLINFLQFN